MSDTTTRLGEELDEQTVARRKEWVAALRSGRYGQGRSALRRGETYCCLGVACDISRLGTWVPAGSVYEYMAGNGDHSERVMPPAVSGYFGFGISNPTLMLDGYRKSSLASLNDGGMDGSSNMDFIEIAGIIERYFLPVTEAE